MKYKVFYAFRPLQKPHNFSAELLEQAKNGLERIYNCLDNLEYLKSMHRLRNNGQ